MAKAIGFVRRSTDMQGASLDDQKVLLSDWMKTAPIVQERGIEPEIARFVEYTGTGTRLGEAFEAILEEVRSGVNDYSFVIVEKLDRLHGRMGDRLLPYLRELKDNGVYVISTDTGTIRNTFDSFAGNVHTFLDIEVSREESRKLAGRMVERGKVKAAKGLWQGGIPPFGYARMEYSPDGKDLGVLPPGVSSREGNRVRLVLDSPAKVEAVQHVFEGYIQGDSLRTLTDWLNSRGFTTTRGSKWTRTVVQNMLKNPLYGGDHTWGKRKQGIFVREENLWGDSGQSWNHDRDKWIVYHDETLRIVSDEVLDAVQKIMSDHVRDYSGVKRPDKFALLDKLVYCETCSSRYYYREEKRGTYLLKRYREYGKNRSVSCKGRVIRADILHDYAEELVQSLISPEIVHEAFDRAREIINAESGMDITLDKSLAPEIRRLEVQERNLVKILKDAPTSQGLITELQRVCDQLDQLRTARDQIKCGGIDSDMGAINQLEREALTFKEIWRRGSAQNRQRIAKAFIQKVEISTDRSTATWEYRSAPGAVCKIQCRGGDSNPHVLADTGF